MTQFIIDTCITIEAADLEAANKDADEIRSTLRTVADRRAGSRSPFGRITGINVCHIEEIPEDAPVEEPSGLLADLAPMVTA